MMGQIRGRGKIVKWLSSLSFLLLLGDDRVIVLGIAFENLEHRS